MELLYDDLDWAGISMQMEKNPLGQTLTVLALWSFSQEYFRGVLASSAYYLTTFKHSRENFRGTLKNRKNPESLAQRILPRSWYSYAMVEWEFVVSDWLLSAWN